MEALQVLFILGVLFFVVTLINGTKLRDPRKIDLIEISRLDDTTLAAYPFVAIVVHNYSRATYGRSTNKVTEKLKVYSVVLLNSTHRKRIKIGGFDTRDEAKAFLLDIAEKYTKQPVKFSPKVSEKTRNRR